LILAQLLSKLLQVNCTTHVSVQPCALSSGWLQSAITDMFVLRAGCCLVALCGPGCSVNFVTLLDPFKVQLSVVWTYNFGREWLNAALHAAADLRSAARELCILRQLQTGGATGCGNV
jgi:hypothetical protein